MDILATSVPLLASSDMHYVAAGQVPFDEYSAKRSYNPTVLYLCFVTSHA
jgi:hypothetical protein